jgi:hypothetical protein
MVSVFFNGRLGNNIFQYIFCRVSAVKNNCNFYIPSSVEESNNFYKGISKLLNIKLEDSVSGNLHHWVGNDLFDIDFGKNDGNINRLLGEVNIEDVTDGSFLNGFYQTDSYMIEYETKIKNKWLRFKKNLKDLSKPLLEKYDVDKYCYIHFRGGDYKTIPQFFLPIDYYRESMNHIVSIKNDIKFVIITDDIVEATNFFPEYDVISNQMEIDFYLLSKAKYSIIPNSSFSWWASWLNNDSKIIVAPNRWFNYNKYYGEGFEPPKIKTNKFYYI